MDYKKLIETISEILENEKIEKKGLTLEYILEDTDHKKLQEYFFYANNSPLTQITYNDVFEIEIGGILVKLVNMVKNNL